METTFTTLAPRDDRTADSGAAPAVERALDIIEYLGRQSAGVTLSELSQALEMPKNAVFRIAHTLVARGFLARDDRTLRFRLTGKFLALGQPVFADVSLAESALPSMRVLRDQTRETVQLGVLAGAEGVILDKVEGLHALRISVDVGLRFKLHNNAPGKLLLAYQPPAERQRLMAAMELSADTPRTITNAADLRRECDGIFSRGYSTDWAEADEGIHCVAAPVLSRRAELLAAIWVSAPSRRMPKDSFPGVAKQVVRAADEIAARIGQ